MVSCPWARYHFICLTVAGAAEEDDQCDNDDPGAVIVKEVAKAVVHKKVLRKNVIGDFPLRYYTMA